MKGLVVVMLFSAAAARSGDWKTGFAIDPNDVAGSPAAHGALRRALRYIKQQRAEA